jgi:hypothetical protein
LVVIPQESASLVCSLVDINIFVYTGWTKSAEFKRWLTKQGVAFEAGKDRTQKVTLNGKTSVLPMHSKDLKKGTAGGIKKQLGIE